MIHLRRHFLLFAAALAVAACHPGIDPVEPVDPVDPAGPAEPEVVPREITDAQKAEELNRTLSSLKTAYEAMKDLDCVTMMAAITENDRVIGYDVHFRRHGYVKFYLDEDVPGCRYGVASIAQQPDGEWYWTYDGECFTVTDGPKVRVCDDLLISRLKYNNWYLCYKDNLLWTSVGQTIGDDALSGIHAVKSLGHDDDTFRLVLSDGRVLEYYWQNSDCDVVFGGEKPVCIPGQGIKLRYSVKSSGSWTMKTEISSPLWSVERIAEDENSGYLAVTSQKGAAEAELAVVLTCGGLETCRKVKLSLGSLQVAEDVVRVGCDGGEAGIVINSDAEWSLAVAEECSSWLSVKDGAVKVAENALKDSRTGSVLILDPLGSVIRTVEIVQAGVEAYHYEMTVAEFVKAARNDVDWFTLEGTVSGLTESGSLTLTDATGSVHVGPLSNYDRYADRLVLPDLVVKVRGHRGGSARDAELTDATVLGVQDPHAKAPRGWMELPACYDGDGLDFFTHSMTIGDLHTRNYSFYWDYANLVSRWVAYPLNRTLQSSGSRTDAWEDNLDPLLPQSQQPLLHRGFSPGNTGISYDRGHQCPSADRYQYNANVETFYGTNMTPQMASLNQNFWVVVEDRVRSWSRMCDTLYVVTGCTLEDSPGYALDNEGKHVTVPGGYFKALLAYKDDASFGHDGYCALAIFLEHRNYTETLIDPAMTISIDDLEARTGIDFFANLPAAVGPDEAGRIEAEQPSGISWWW